MNDEWEAVHWIRFIVHRSDFIVSPEADLETMKDER